MRLRGDDRDAVHLQGHGEVRGGGVEGQPEALLIRGVFPLIGLHRVICHFLCAVVDGSRSAAKAVEQDLFTPIRAADGFQGIIQPDIEFLRIGTLAFYRLLEEDLIAADGLAQIEIQQFKGNLPGTLQHSALRIILLGQYVAADIRILLQLLLGNLKADRMDIRSHGQNDFGALCRFAICHHIVCAIGKADQAPVVCRPGLTDSDENRSRLHHFDQLKTCVKVTQIQIEPVNGVCQRDSLPGRHDFRLNIDDCCFLCVIPEGIRSEKVRADLPVERGKEFYRMIRAVNVFNIVPIRERVSNRYFNLISSRYINADTVRTIPTPPEWMGAKQCL